MNKTALKNFAVNARNELREKITVKALQFGISEERIKKADILSSDDIFIDGKPLDKDKKSQRDALIKRVYNIGFNQVIEEVAYTWFNRFTALRFMEVNNYLPTKIRVLSSRNPGSFEPDIVQEALNVDLDIDKEYVYELKLNNKSEELFKYLIIKQCNSLNPVLPFMFKQIADYTELLFPDGLLAEGSFLSQMTDTDVFPEEDWADVEIIGWLYQYYIAEEKDRVIKAKAKYKTKEIPFATQLFTPDWIVRYMVQNSLGRYWVESHPEDRELLKEWEFYLENPNSEPDFEEKLAPYINKELEVEEIKFFDPAMGSGHILVYAFDVFFEIYSKCGYMEREIPRLIIENNLYGLDIDDRAYQLACFSVVMKAMQYNSRFFRSIEREGLNLNLASIQETNDLNEEDIAYIAGENSGSNFENTKIFIEQFRDAKTIGSLIKINEFDKDFLSGRLEYIQNNPAKDMFEDESRRKVVDLLPQLIHQAEILDRVYDVLATNPPYMGSKYMNAILTEYMKKNYSETKSDTFSAFMDICMTKVKDRGHLGFLTPVVWMFIGSYEKLRERIVNNKTLSSLIQLEYNAFPEACVPVCTFTIRNYSANLSGECIKLTDFKGIDEQEVKTIEAINNPTVEFRYSVQSNSFNKIPGTAFAYWSTETTRQIFEDAIQLGEIAEPKQGLATADNKRFVRNWFEVSIDNIGFGSANSEEAVNKGVKWFPFNNGGGFRKWYGNNFDVVNWENNGEEIKNSIIERYPYLNGNYSFVIKNESKYFEKGITWNAITSNDLSVRAFDEGYLFSNAGMAIFEEEVPLQIIIAYLNSKIVQHLLSFISNTINFNQGDIKKTPIILNNEYNDMVFKLSSQSIDISKNDWDSFEISWDFQKHPLLTYKKGTERIQESFSNWSNFADEQFYRLKSNEEELNKLFIEIYGLQEEMTPEVTEENVTIRKANKERDIKSFISYAVGCMFGRYSLDEEGLVFAGGKFDSESYQTFKADKDNILPILSGAYFEDDIVSRFVEFVKVVFGEATLQENLDFIADTLGKKSGETAKETIRRYFVNDFFKDHVQVYKKRPIYWMFTSGKQKAFNCLIYMHRYDKSTLSRIRTDYLHELQNRLFAERKGLVSIIEGDSTVKEISNAKKELKTLDKKIEEVKAFDEVLHHLADKQIEIDLDDGVVTNYEMFKGLLAKI
ncbi:BREX-1 system adenine-specific DNA-methyltransferase PglX [Bacillus sp. MB2021]|uniref:BREX-1 system adenine-specific DNA-methyltransferase PglX n=1 Tax=Bacillus sp. MB2021 TaxID=1408303 RepID=UPI0004E0DFCA|nr:BREX-1 system adenine-specific DNA-methyltransferase PglX [Bacillus sp. MB2021]